MSAPLRPAIADILEGLAFELPYSFAWDGNKRKSLLYLGAETLRWTHEREDGPAALLEQIEGLQGALEDAERALATAEPNGDH